MVGLSWEEPPQPHPPIDGYYVHSHTRFPISNSTRRLANPNIRKLDLTELEPMTTYWIWVSGYGPEGEGPSSEVLKVDTDVGSPGPPRILNLTCTDHALLILWEAPALYHRSVDFFYVTLREENGSAFTELRLPAELNDLNQQEFMVKNLTRERWYDVGVLAGTRSNVDPKIIRRSTYSQLKMVRITAECGEEDDATSQPTSLLILLSVSASLLVVLLLLSLFLWRRCLGGNYYYLEDPRSLPPLGVGWEGEDELEGAKPIPVDLFPVHVAELHVDSDIGFSKEYEAIQTLTEQLPTTVALHPDNKLKNRYLNILPYDHSRVRVGGCRGEKRCSEYMNGNYIDGFLESGAYIGTQGPLPGTAEAFWRVVWDHGVGVIVMITNLVERGRKKCDQYWPAEGSEVYGQLQVRTLKEEVRSTHILRTLAIWPLKAKSAPERRVFQYHYTNWPDHGTPSHPLPVLSFVKKSSAANPPSAPPIIVHCSAGVGRTGTYIVLDAMLKQIKSRGDVNVFGFLHHIRTQRNFLVQTEEQYIFIHDALLEAIQSGETEVSLSELSSYVHKLQTEKWTDDTGTQSLLQRQFQLVRSFVPKEFEQSVGLKAVNVSKNRNPTFLPTDAYRVVLIPKPGQEGSDYINASFLPGLSRLSEFILSQHPLPDTIPSFWQMVSDHNVERIVLLSAADEETYAQFWPADTETELRLDGLRLRLVTTSDRAGLVISSLALTSADEDEMSVELIHAPHWPHDHPNPHHLFHLIQLVQDSDPITGPTLVVDRFGGVEGGTFCALTTLCNQLDAEDRLDVYLVAKLYHEHRPGIWQTLEDFTFLYTSIDGLTKGGKTPELRSEETSPCKDSGSSTPLCPTTPPEEPKTAEVTEAEEDVEGEVEPERPLSSPVQEPLKLED